MRTMAIDEARESLAAKRTVVIVAIVLLMVIAWANRFVQDDAFISFRYAENMAAGHGLVWNAGEDPVEGYTNFSWTVLIAGAIALGFDPVGASYVLGLLAFAGQGFVTLLLLGIFGAGQGLVTLWTDLVSPACCKRWKSRYRGHDNRGA